MQDSIHKNFRASITNVEGMVLVHTVSTTSSISVQIGKYVMHWHQYARLNMQVLQHQS